MKTIATMAAVAALSLPLAAAAQSNDLSQTGTEAIASGLGINLPLVARLIGAGATLYTSVGRRRQQHRHPAQVDFYLDGIDIALLGSDLQDRHAFPRPEQSSGRAPAG